MPDNSCHQSNLAPHVLPPNRSHTMPCHQARLISPLMIVLPRGVNFCQLRPTFVTVMTKQGLTRQNVHQGRESDTFPHCGR